MRTPKEYSDMVKNRQLTMAMIAECIYSVNKRAKNYRDKKKEYSKRSFRNFRNIQSSDEKMEEYYEYKEDLLIHFTPISIHYQNFGEETKRVYSYERDYEKLLEEKKDVTVWENFYYDWDESRVDFFDYKTGRDKKVYFYYYEIGGYGFHSPISAKIAEQSKLELVDIGKGFVTKGKDIHELLSVSFVKKVIALLDSEDYTIVD